MVTKTEGFHFGKPPLHTQLNVLNEFPRRVLVVFFLILPLVGLFYLQLAFLHCKTYNWSLLLTESWLGLFLLRLKFGWVFFAYCGKSVWSIFTYLSTPEIGFGPFCLRFPTISKKTSRK